MLVVRWVFNKKDNFESLKKTTGFHIGGVL